MFLVQLTTLALAVTAGAVLALGPRQEKDEHAPEQPVAQHARLAKLAGHYTTATSFDMGDGSKPVESTGKAEFKSILGGRFLAQEESGSMLAVPFDALKMYGYNAPAGRYEALWVYTGSTAMMTMTGTSNDGGKTIAFDASYARDPKGAKMEFTITLSELDAERFEIDLLFKAAPGAPSGKLKTVYTRAK